MMELGHFKKFIHKNCTIYIADIIFDINQLKCQISLSESNELFFENIKNERRKAEWLSVRYYLQSILDAPIQICYLESGKPFLEGSDWRISISHSNEKIAIILSSNYSVAIDIENISERTLKVQHKYVRDDEKLMFPIFNAYSSTLIWCAKETLYKLIQIQNVDFLNNLIVSEIDSTYSKTSFEGKYISANLILSYTLNFFNYQNFIVVWSCDRGL